MNHQKNEFIAEKPEYLRLFEEICRIPHASGNEKNVAAFLTSLAKGSGLTVKCDAAGNLRIDRAASPGFENAPAILMEGHMDMVPQTIPGSSFDFSRDPIETAEHDGFLMSANHTTLGADNGIGVSMAMTLLLDPTLRCGKLGAIFTVEEETGLAGALALSPEMLDADVLLNIDDEDEHEFCIGCAGGARLEISIPLHLISAFSGTIGAELHVSGMKGGHSGMDIDKKRGNSLLALVRVLEAIPEFSVSSIAGGNLDNAIPRESHAEGFIAPEKIAEAEAVCKKLETALRAEFDVSPEFSCRIERRDTARTTIWEPEFQKRLLEKLRTVPNGVVDFDKALNAVRTSGNFAALIDTGKTIVLRSLLRSCDDNARNALLEKIVRHFKELGGIPETVNSYPGWNPSPNSPILGAACEIYRKRFGRDPDVRVIHAGVECGIFSKKAPGLDMISMGPTIENPHSPGERLNLASAERFFGFLRELIESYCLK